MFIANTELTATEKLERLEVRAKLALGFPGPSAEMVQQAEGIISGEKVTVRIINGLVTRYELPYSEGGRLLTRAEVLTAIA